MPHRITTIPADVFGMLAAWLVQPVATLTGWVSKEDWERIIGPFGGLLLSLVVSGIMLRLFLHSSKQSRADAEKRHSETLALQERNSEKLTQLTAEGIKAQLAMSHAMSNLKETLDERPCGITPKNRINPMP